MTETENIQITEAPHKTTFPEKVSIVLSAIFNPFLIPSFAFVLLFAFTYLSIMPIQYVMFVISIVVAFTIVSPSATYPSAIISPASAYSKPVIVSSQ